MSHHESSLKAQFYLTAWISARYKHGTTSILPMHGLIQLKHKILPIDHV